MKPQQLPKAVGGLPPRCGWSRQPSGRAVWCSRRTSRQSRGRRSSAGNGALVSVSALPPAPAPPLWVGYLGLGVSEAERIDSVTKAGSVRLGQRLLTGGWRGLQPGPAHACAVSACLPACSVSAPRCPAGVALQGPTASLGLKPSSPVYGGSLTLDGLASVFSGTPAVGGLTELIGAKCAAGPWPGVKCLISVRRGYCY